MFIPSHKPCYYCQIRPTAGSLTICHASSRPEEPAWNQIWPRGGGRLLCHTVHSVTQRETLKGLSAVSHSSGCETQEHSFLSSTVRCKFPYRSGSLLPCINLLMMLQEILLKDAKRLSECAECVISHTNWLLIKPLISFDMQACLFGIDD